MTPRQLLNDVLKRFAVLLHDDPLALDELLVTALTAYQDRAGLVANIRINKEDCGDKCSRILFPSNYLSLISVTDKTGDLVYTYTDETAVDLDLMGNEVWPLTMSYLINLRNIDLENGSIPEPIIGMLKDYLEILISIPNTARIRRVTIAGKMDTSSLPEELSLNERKSDLEIQMAERRSILPMLTIYSSQLKPQRKE